MHDMLVITPGSWRTVLEPFVRYKNDIDMPTALLTVEDIYAQYPGNDVPDKIKRAIDIQHRQDGIKYVMLVGDVDRCPVRYIRATNTQWGVKWYPSDLYYADLYDDNGDFNDWDAGDNGIYGEVDFSAGDDLVKTNIDKINMVPDVSVGRVPASKQGELTTYLQKVMDYEFAARESFQWSYDSDWARKAVFFVDGGRDPFGDMALAQQYAAPLANAGISVFYRYQDDPLWTGPNQQKRTDEFTRVVNNGVGFLCYFGHGTSSSFDGWYTDSDLNSLTNRLRTPIIYAISCLTAKFQPDMDSYLDVSGHDWTGGVGSRPQPAALQPAKHDRDSMAEEFLVKHATGAVAYIGTTDVIEHGGKNIARYFFEAYRNASKPPVLGDLWQVAMSKFARSDARRAMAWYAFIHLHKVMLFGDPSLRVGGLPPRPSWRGGTPVPSEVMSEALA